MYPWHLRAIIEELNGAEEGRGEFTPGPQIRVGPLRSTNPAGGSATWTLSCGGQAVDMGFWGCDLGLFTAICGGRADFRWQRWLTELTAQVMTRQLLLATWLK